jgi:hypothetical protein
MCSNFTHFSFAYLLDDDECFRLLKQEMSLHFCKTFPWTLSSPAHCVFWRPILIRDMILTWLPAPSNRSQSFRLYRLTTAWICHVEAGIVQWLDCRLCALGILVRFLRKPRDRFSCKAFKPALDPKQHPLQRVRGCYPRVKAARTWSRQLFFFVCGATAQPGHRLAQCWGL